MRTFTDLMLHLRETVELQETSMSRIMSHMQHRNIGNISAFRGSDEDHETHPEWAKQLSPEKKATTKQKLNMARHKELEGHIKTWVKGQQEKGHEAGYKQVKGRYVENHGTPHATNVDERSFLIWGRKGHDGGALKKFLTKHGKKYNQDSILYKPHNSDTATLIGTNHSGFPGHQKGHQAGQVHLNRTPQFHTVVKGGGVNSGKHGEKEIQQKGTGKVLKRTGPPSPKTYAFQNDKQNAKTSAWRERLTKHVAAKKRPDVEELA